MQRHDVVISTQVLNEFTNVLSKKFKTPWPDILKTIAEITDSSSVSVVTIDTVKHAINLAGRYKFSYYDSLILASALENDCERLYSEDLAHLQVVGGVLQIINPFK